MISDVSGCQNHPLVLFTCSVNLCKVNSLQPHELQQASLPCPSLSPEAGSNSCPLNQWCYPNILSSVALSPFAFNLSQHQGLFQWAESSHQVAKALNRASASASVLPMNIQGRFLLGLTDLISLQSKGLSRVFSNTTVQKYPFLATQPSLWSNTHICTWLLEKP